MRFIGICNRAICLFCTATPLVIFCLCGGEYTLPILLAVTVHELAHLAALWICRGEIRRFRPAPFGFCIAYDARSLSPLSECIVVAAGAVANFCFALLFFVLGLSTVALVNLLIGLMNLLPFLPLDGGRLLYIGIAYVTTPFHATRVLRIVTHVCGFLLFLPASYLLLTGSAGVYPLLFSLYIFAANAAEMAQSEKR